jgi:hypothetical protein
MDQSDDEPSLSLSSSLAALLTVLQMSNYTLGDDDEDEDEEKRERETGAPLIPLQVLIKKTYIDRWRRRWWLWLSIDQKLINKKSPFLSRLVRKEKKKRAESGPSLSARCPADRAQMSSIVITVCVRTTVR